MFLIFIFLIQFIQSFMCLNILFYTPTLSHSHISFNTKLAEMLASNGHRVTILLPVVDNSITIAPQKNWTSMIEIVEKNVGVPNDHLRNVLWNNPGPYDDSSPLNPRIFFKLLKVSNTFVKACQNIASDQILINNLRNQHFDIGLVEQYDSCGFGIFNSIGIKSTIWLSATAIFRVQSEEMGINLPFSYVPELFAHFNDEMSIFQKLLNFLIGTVTSFVLDVFAQTRQSKIFQKLGYLKHGQDLSSLSQQSSSVLINSAAFFDYSMPMGNQFSNIGGFTVDKKRQKLNPYWKSIADNAVNGFILVSFGGIARTIDMPKSMQQIFFSSFSKFPNITFIVKYESCNITFSIPENVILTPWIPQLPLMAHPNYKSILTHGGWSSILETTIYSKPMILMPLFADHAKNSKVAESKGVAVLLDKLNLNESTVVSVIHQILTDFRFTKRCEKFSKMFNDLPTSHENLINWRVRQASKLTKRTIFKFLKPKIYKFPYLEFFICSIFVFYYKFLK